MSEKIKIRIAIYSRKSKFSDKGDSVGNQIEIAMEYIKIHFPNDIYDAQIVIYEDEGFSGGSFDRPEFKKFLDEERKNPFNVLICYRLDRISRNISDFSSLIDELSKLETNFVSIKEQFDTKTPMGRAMMYIASVFAQLEREVIAERIRDNLLELAKNGTWLGGDTPIGFKAKRYKKVNVCEESLDSGVVKKAKTASKLIVDKAEMKTVLLIYSKFKELKSLSKLETYLMNNNIKTRKGAYFSIQAIKKILTNPAYVKNDEDTLKYFEEKGIHIYAESDGRNKFNGKYGLMTYNKTSGKKELPIEKWIFAVGLQPGIISGKDWIAVQLLLEKNTSKRYRSATGEKKQSIVSGLIRCKKCGSFMRPRNMDKRRADGSVNYRYCCQLKEKSRGKKCDSQNVAGEQLDNKIIDIIKETFVPNSEIYKELKKMATIKNDNAVNEELEFLEKRYAQNQEEIEKLIENLKYIDIDLMDMVNQNLRKLKEEKLDLEKQIDSLKKSSKSTNTSLEMKTAKDILKIIDGSFDIFNTFDLKTKRDIAGIFIESIQGEGEEIEINFLNTKIDENKKKMLIPTISKSDCYSTPKPASKKGGQNLI